MIHVIEIREIVGGTKPGTVKFKSTANLTYNCNKEEFNGHWAVGEKYKIDFNTSSFQGSRGPVEMKWVNNARFWQEGDGPVDPPEKPVYQGGGGGSYSGGGNKGGGKSMSKSDYDPEIGKRQTAANNAGLICAELLKNVPEAEKMDSFAFMFPAIADIVLQWVNEKPKSTDVSGMGEPSDGDAGGNAADGDIPF